MMKKMIRVNVNDIRQMFAQLYLNEVIINDKSGLKVFEILGASFIADSEQIFGKPNKDYITREINWYNSQSRNILDIEDQVPQIWKNVCDIDGNINSNYGWCIYSEKNHRQYDRVLAELKRESTSRRTSMIYTRPKMWNDYNTRGMSDFMCTHAVDYAVRDNKLYVTVHMRSQDAWAGYRNDYAWQNYIQKRLASDLNVLIGDIYWSVSSLHLYSSYWYLLYHYLRSGSTHISIKEFKEIYGQQILNDLTKGNISFIEQRFPIEM